MNDLEQQFSLPRNTAALRTEKYKRYKYFIIIIIIIIIIAASKIGNGVILLPWKLRCNFNPDQNKFSS